MPAGVQLENIGPRHQHIDLIYFARPAGSTEIRDEFADEKIGWYPPEDWGADTGYFVASHFKVEFSG